MISRTPHRSVITLAMAAAAFGCGGESAEPGTVLPFPPPPTASTAGRTLQQSEHRWREVRGRLPEDAPNIVIVMLDDAGFGQASTFGGDVATPTLSRLADEGIAYNAFHTTAMCSPTRASLLTGRNHHRVGAGQIAELANDWDGYTGEIPKTAATLPAVLRYYGYATAAFGKWHNTPVDALATARTTGFPRASASTTSTASSRARRRSGSRPCGKTRRRSPRLTRTTTRTTT